MKKVSIAAMIVVMAAALNGCTYSSGTKVATGGTNPPPTTPPPTNPPPTTPPPTTPPPTTPPPTTPPPAGTPTPVVPTNPAPIAIPPAGSNEQMNPVHGILLTTGNVLYIAGSGNCPPGQAGCPTGFGSATLWNPTTNAFTTF